MSRILQKIKSFDEAASQIAQWKANHKKVVFTNGCFDIVHSGHVLYLDEAKSHGDRLIVGLNSDDSVRRLKGAKRPFNSYKSRATVLAAMESVDLIVEFKEDTPQNLILSILPNVLVKGGDYDVEEIVGSYTVLSHGGQVKSLMFKKGFSTSSLIRKIREEHGQ